MKKILYFIIPAIALGLLFLIKCHHGPVPEDMQHDIDSLITDNQLLKFESNQHEQASARLKAMNDSIEEVKAGIHSRYEAQQATIKSYSALISFYKAKEILAHNGIDTTIHGTDSLTCYNKSENNFILVEISRLSEADSIIDELQLQVNNSKMEFVHDSMQVAELKKIIANDDVIDQKKGEENMQEIKVLKRKILRQKIYKSAAIALAIIATSAAGYFSIKNGIK